MAFAINVKKLWLSEVEDFPFCDAHAYPYSAPFRLLRSALMGEADPVLIAEIPELICSVQRSFAIRYLCCTIDVLTTYGTVPLIGVITAAGQAVLAVRTAEHVSLSRPKNLPEARTRIARKRNG